ncbi:hypothetical protein CN563_24685, partial [Bacillus sp. AFS026049]
CGKSVANGDPASENRGGFRTARGKRVPGVDTLTQKTVDKKDIFKNKVDWNGRRETPAGKARLGETPQAQAKEAPRPPAESECLEWKSTLLSN